MASELALEIAQLRWPKAKIHYEDWDTDHRRPLFIPSGKPLRTHKIDLVPMPEPDKDPAACLELLDYVTSLEEVLQVACHRSYAGQASCYVLFRKSQEAHEGSADTLQEAIARACLAALRAVREGQTP